MDKRNFNIWMKGYQASGDSAPDQYLGTGYGTTFKEACKELASRDEEFKKYFTVSTMTYYGCKLYEGDWN